MLRSQLSFNTIRYLLLALVYTRLLWRCYLLHRQETLYAATYESLPDIHRAYVTADEWDYSRYVNIEINRSLFSMAMKECIGITALLLAAPIVVTLFRLMCCLLKRLRRRKLGSGMEEGKETEEKECESKLCCIVKHVVLFLFLSLVLYVSSHR